MDLEELRDRRNALLRMRYEGVRQTTIDGRTVVYASDAEMAAALRDLDRQIALAQRRGRRVRRAVTSKDL